MFKNVGGEVIWGGGVELIVYHRTDIIRHGDQYSPLQRLRLSISILEVKFSYSEKCTKCIQAATITFEIYTSPTIIMLIVNICTFSPDQRNSFIQYSLSTHYKMSTLQ